MAVILQMTYQKELGLPKYSSHACSVSLTVEIPDASVAAQESTKLYALLQTAVDMDEHDREENERSLGEGFRLMSVYRTRACEKFHIITEHERSVTTAFCRASIETMGCFQHGGSPFRCR